MSCQCGFKHVDTLHLRHDMDAIARRGHGTFGLLSESFVTNVEGILDRIESIVQMSKK
ncbi:MAG: hypothetical protein BME93_06485 [Methanosarcinales archaeon Met12]|nr:MAG: hypothetical protein BME93_06485 [Methanosarcinales archaeon Met12]